MPVPPPSNLPKVETGTQPAPPAPPRPGLNTDTVALGALFVAIFAFLAALVAVGLASRAIDEHRAVQATTRSPPQRAEAGVAVSLSESSIQSGSD